MSNQCRPVDTGLIFLNYGKCSNYRATGIVQNSIQKSEQKQKSEQLTGSLLATSVRRKNIRVDTTSTFILLKAVVTGTESMSSELTGQL